MRRNELDARVAERVLPSLTSAHAALIVGAELAQPQSIACFPSISALDQAQGSFGAALWLPVEELEQGLAVLRCKLTAGATLWVAAAREPRPMQRLRSLVTRERIKLWTLPELSSALLLAGLRAPRVEPLDGGYWLLAAELPNERDPLDAFFEQPSTNAAR